jgi:predicted porin
LTVGLSRFGYERADAAARTTSATNANEIRVGYADGPLSITGSALSHSGGSIAKRNEIVGSYDAGVAKVSLGWSDTDTDTDAVIATAVSVPLGAIALQYSTASKDTAKFTTYGADYSFSKQTRLRAHYSVDDNNGTKVNGYRVQLVKAF